MAKPYVSAFSNIMEARPDGQLMQVKWSENLRMSMLPRCGSDSDVQAHIIAEINKDLTKHTIGDIEKHLTG